MKGKSNSYKKVSNHHGGFEIAIRRQDLEIKGKCWILEKKSSSEYQKLPYVGYPPEEYFGYPGNYVQSNNIIRSDQPWCVEFNWQVCGPLACLLDCGHWKAKVYFEMMGGGETRYSPEELTQDVGIPDHEYNCKIDVKPNALNPGAYRIVTCLQYCFENGSPGPIVGFEDLGLINVYDYKRFEKKTYAENPYSDPKYQDPYPGGKHTHPYPGGKYPDPYAGEKYPGEKLPYEVKTGENE